MTRTGGPPAEDRLRVAARALVFDEVTARLADAFETAGIRLILIKGPTIARWLYEDELLRPYDDLDLLVSPAGIEAAGKILEAGDFEMSLSDIALPHGRRPHAQMWVRRSDGLTVDLHDTLPGLGVSPEAAWTALSEGTDTMVVGKKEIEVLQEPARALLIALHLAHHGVKDSRTFGDLTRALALLSEATWRDAAALAERLDAVPSFAAGLRLSPEGNRLATKLGLPDVTTVELELRSGSAPELAFSLDWLVRTKGLRPRAHLVWRKLVPPKGVLKARSRLAARGTTGLAAAYVVNPLIVMWQAIPAVSAWLDARRRARRGSN